MEAVKQQRKGKKGRSRFSIRYRNHARDGGRGERGADISGVAKMGENCSLGSREKEKNGMQRSNGQ